MHCWARYETEKKEHGKIQKELDAANERFKEYERKDVKLREDIKHLQAKQKKLADKRGKDAAKAQVTLPIAGPAMEWWCSLGQLKQWH